MNKFNHAGVLKRKSVQVVLKFQHYLDKRPPFINLIIVALLAVIIGGGVLFTHAQNVNHAKQAKHKTAAPASQAVQSSQTSTPTSITTPTHTASNTTGATSTNKAGANSANTSGTSSGSASSNTSGAGQGSTPPQVQPSPITGWQAVSGGVDQCTSGSQGDRIYCAPGQIGTWYINTTKGTTIKSYYEVNGLDQGAMSGVTVSYFLVSPSQLRVQVSSNRTYDPFNVYVMISVNELASPQQQIVGAGWFQYNAGCLNTPPMAGCAR